jgi:hypothetical protein
VRFDSIGSLAGALIVKILRALLKQNEEKFKTSRYNASVSTMQSIKHWMMHWWPAISNIYCLLVDDSTAGDKFVRNLEKYVIPEMWRMFSKDEKKYLWSEILLNLDLEDIDTKHHMRDLSVVLLNNPALRELLEDREVFTESYLCSILSHSAEADSLQCFLSGFELLSKLSGIHDKFFQIFLSSYISRCSAAEVSLSTEIHMNFSKIAHSFLRKSICKDEDCVQAHSIWTSIWDLAFGKGRAKISIYSVDVAILVLDLTRYCFSAPSLFNVKEIIMMRRNQLFDMIFDGFVEVRERALKLLLVLDNESFKDPGLYLGFKKNLVSSIPRKRAGAALIYGYLFNSSSPPDQGITATNCTLWIKLILPLIQKKCSLNRHILFPKS